MDIIEFDRWKPSADDPCKLEYAGQHLAQEVFEELTHRLESQGYLPGEYFLMDREWEDGREIPQGCRHLLRHRLRRKRGRISGRLPQMVRGR